MSLGSAAVNVVNTAAVDVLVVLVYISVASAAAGPACGCVTLGTRLRSGCTRRYSCPFCGGTFAACHSV